MIWYYIATYSLFVKNVGIPCRELGEGNSILFDNAGAGITPKMDVSWDARSCSRDVYLRGLTYFKTDQNQVHDFTMFGWRGNRVGIAVGKGSVRVFGVSGTATQYH